MSAPAGNVAPSPITTTPRAFSSTAQSRPAHSPARTAAPSAFTGGDVIRSTATPLRTAKPTADDISRTARRVLARLRCLLLAHGSLWLKAS